MMTPAQKRTARQVENIGFIAGLFVAFLYAVGEFIVHMGFVHPPEHREFPWMTAVLVVACVAPKTLGKATAGQVWVILAQGLARAFGKRGDALSIEAKCGKCGNAMTACVCPA